MRINRPIATALAALLALSFAACDKTENPPQPATPVQHTALIYMIANHSGSVPACLKNNILEAVKGVKAGTLRDGRLLVYFNASEKWASLSPLGSTLMEIRYDPAKGRSTIDTLKVYGNHKSIDPDVMRSIFADARAAAPADNYGLIMGSHGTGWFPASMEYTELQSMEETPAHAAEPWQVLASKDLEHAETRAFGVDGRTPEGKWDWMETVDLAAALRGQQFDYLIFDACFMSSIEALYDMRDTGIGYIAASPAEVMAKGYPYDEIVPLLFRGTPEEKCKTVAAQIMDYYRNRYSGTKSASIAVIKCDELAPLAAAVKDMIAASPETGREGVQYYDALENHAFFDLEHYLRLRSEGSGEAYAKLAEALNRCVLLHDCTDQIFSYNGRGYKNINIAAENSCGVTCYIPSDDEPLTRQAWEETAWYRDTH